MIRDAELTSPKLRASPTYMRLTVRNTMLQFKRPKANTALALLPVLGLLACADANNAAPYTEADAGSSASAGSGSMSSSHTGGAGSGSTNSGSGGTHNAAGSSANTGSGGAAASCSTLTYASFGQNFLSTYCLGCHGGTVTGAARMGAPTDAVFDTLAEVKAESRKLMSEVVTKRTMPFGNAKKPTDAERTEFGQWLSCGAP